jgi:hypothetical protein
MKNALKLLGLLGLSLIFAALPAAAQGQKLLILNVPFSFSVEKQTMPAGTYRILVEHNWLQIRGRDSKTAGIVLTQLLSGKPPEGFGKVVFNRYGDRYFLSQVWLPGMELGRQTPESREEKRLAKQETLQAVVIEVDGEARKTLSLAPR